MFRSDPESTVPPVTPSTVRNVIGQRHLPETTTVAPNDPDPPPPANVSLVSDANSSLTHLVPKGYLVYSGNCKIASLDPMARDVMKLYHREKALSCATKDPLTSVEWSAETNKYYLTINEAARKAYHLSATDRCTFQEITRKSENQIR